MVSQLETHFSLFPVEAPKHTQSYYSLGLTLRQWGNLCCPPHQTVSHWPHYRDLKEVGLGWGAFLPIGAILMRGANIWSSWGGALASEGEMSRAPTMVSLWLLLPQWGLLSSREALCKEIMANCVLTLQLILSLPSPLLPLPLPWPASFFKFCCHILYPTMFYIFR